MHACLKQNNRIVNNCALLPASRKEVCTLHIDSLVVRLLPLWEPRLATVRSLG
jgi:hypothetical protein